MTIQEYHERLADLTNEVALSEEPSKIFNCIFALAITVAVKSAAPLDILHERLKEGLAYAVWKNSQ